MNTKNANDSVSFVQQKSKIEAQPNERLNVCLLQHSDGSPPGTIDAWLISRGHNLMVVHLHKNEPLPSLIECDWIIVLGGPMGVDDTLEFPWLQEEKNFLTSAIAANKTCLGICLGSQLLAQILGGTVKRHQHWEAGWFPIQLTHEFDSRFSNEIGSNHLMPEQQLMVFHFHQDTFSLPAGAKLLAKNEITESQMFAYQEHVLGIQFHPESNREWLESFADETPYPSGPFVQSYQELMSQIHYLEPMTKWFALLLEKMEHIADRNKNRVKSKGRAT